MKKKILVLCLCVILAAIALMYGTMAYFTDTAAASASVITVGKVNIDWQSITWKLPGGDILWERKDKTPPTFSFEDGKDVKLMPAISYPAELVFAIAEDSNAAYTRVRVRFHEEAAFLSGDIAAFDVNFDSITVTTNENDAQVNLLSVENSVEPSIEKDGEYVYFTYTFDQPIPKDSLINIKAHIGLKKELNNAQVAELASLSEDELEFHFVVEAIQTTGFENVTEAFEAFEAKRAAETTTAESTATETTAN